jgi:hypothetical protein
MRWRREAWHRIGHAVYQLGSRARFPLSQHALNQLYRPLDLLIGHRLDAALKRRFLTEREVERLMDCARN